MRHDAAAPPPATGPAVPAPPVAGSAGTVPVVAAPAVTEPAATAPSATGSVLTVRAVIGPALAGAAAVLVAAVVLVVLRLPDRPGARGPWAPFDAALARALFVDRILSLVTWVGYVATLLVVGGSLFRSFVSRPPPSRRGPPERLLAAAALVGVVAAVGSLPLRAMVLADGEVGALADLDVVRVVATSRFGDAACLRILALGSFALVLRHPPRGWERRVRVIRPAGTLLVFASIARTTVERAAHVAAGLAAVASFTFVGHPQASEPRGLLVLSQTVHLAAAAVWFGGGALLAVEIRGARRRGTAGCSARTVARFSVLAGGAVVAVGITGAVLAVSQLSSPGALLSSAYGRALSAKLALVALVVALGTYNHVRLVPAVVAVDDRRAWRRLGATAAAEAAIIAAGVLVATAAMTSGGL